MKKTSKKILVAVMAAVTAFAVPTVAFMDDVPALNSEEQAVKDALTGAIETQIQIAKFDAPDGSDGTVNSLSSEEINQLINDYDSRVDKYYTKDYGGYEYYKYLNKYYLTDVMKNDAVYLVDAGVPACDVQSVHFSDSGNVADVKAYIMMDSQWVDYDREDDDFKVTDSISVEKGHYRLVKDSGNWKVKKVIDSDYASGDMTPENAARSLSRGTDVKVSDIKKAVERKDRVTSASYPDFQSALAAVKTVDNKLITDNINPVKFVRASGHMAGNGN